MKRKDEIITKTIFDYCEKNNVNFIVSNNQKSKLYDIDVIYIVLNDYEKDDNSPLSKSFMCSVDLSKKLQQITEVQIVINYVLQPNDIIIYSTSNNNDKIIYNQYLPPLTDIKGYYTINSIVSSLITNELNTYKECFDHLKLRFNRKDTLYNTCKMLFKMYDELKSKMVLDWFQHDTPLIKQLRHSSPFVYSLRFVDEDDYLQLLREVVNNPQNHYSRPNYDVWLKDVLQKEQIPPFFMRYIPDNIFIERGIEISNDFKLPKPHDNWEQQLKLWKEEMDSGNFHPVVRRVR